MANRVLITAAGSAGARCAHRGLQILERLLVPPAVTVVSCLDGPAARSSTAGTDSDRFFTHISPKLSRGAAMPPWADAGLVAIVTDAVQELIVVDDDAAVAQLSVFLIADQSECEANWGADFVSRWAEAVVAAVTAAAPQTVRTVGFRAALVLLGDPCSPGKPLHAIPVRWSDFRVPTRTIAGEYSQGDAEETASLLVSLLLATSRDTNALPGVDEGANPQAYAVWIRAVDASPIEEHRHLAAELTRSALEHAHRDRRTTRAPAVGLMQAAPGEVLNPNLREHGRTMASRLRGEFAAIFPVPGEDVVDLDIVRQWTTEDRLAAIRAWLSARELTAAHESAAWYAQEFVPKASEFVRSWERDLRDVMHGRRPVALDEGTTAASPSLPATLSVIRSVRTEDLSMAAAALDEAARGRLTPLSFDAMRAAQSALVSAIATLPIEARVRLWPWLVAGVASLLLSPIVFELAAYVRPSPYGLAGGWWTNAIYWTSSATSLVLGPPFGPIAVWLFTGAALSLVARRRWRAARQQLREFLNPQQGRFIVAATDLIVGARGSVAARVIGGIRHHSAQLRADVHQRRADGWGSVIEKIESLEAHLTWLETELAGRVELRMSATGAVRTQLVTCGPAELTLAGLRDKKPDPVDRLLRHLAPPASPADVNRWLQSEAVIDEAVRLLGGDLPVSDERQMRADLDARLSSVELPQSIVHCDAYGNENAKASLWHIAATEMLASRLAQFPATPPVCFVPGTGPGFTVILLALQPLPQVPAPTKPSGGKA